MSGSVIMIRATLLLLVSAVLVPGDLLAGVKLPAFLGKVQLHNLDGFEATADGQGVRLYRVPAVVREQLTDASPYSKMTSGDMMRKARHSEIRFVCNRIEKYKDIRIHLQTPKAGARVTIYWGDIFSSSLRLKEGGGAAPVAITGHSLLLKQINSLPRGRFANHVVRVIIKGDEVTLHGIEGDVRPPRPEELAPVMLSYGSSISEGFNASRPDLQYNSLLARFLHYDLLNLGSSGTAYCEEAMADYMATQAWDLAVLEISVNMVSNYTPEEFQKRASYMIDTLAASHPDAPIFCLSILPNGMGSYNNGQRGRKAQRFRDALRKLVQKSRHKNVHYLHGPEVLSLQGLYHDMLHPSDMGMIEMAINLSKQIRAAMATGEATAHP